MADNQKAAEAPVVEAPSVGDEPKAAPVPVPLTLQVWSDKANALIDEAIAADLSWGPALAAIVAKRGKGLLDQARVGIAAWIDHNMELFEGGGNTKAAQK